MDVKHDLLPLRVRIGRKHQKLTQALDPTKGHLTNRAKFLPQITSIMVQSIKFFLGTPGPVCQFKS